MGEGGGTETNPTRESDLTGREYEGINLLMTMEFCVEFVVG